MDLRVLVYMNPLVVDKISKKFLWEKDSGFLYIKDLLMRLPMDWRITVLVPKGFNSDFFLPQARQIINCEEYDYSTSIHQNRYHFNRNIIAKLLPYTTDVDLILNNQPEVTANLRVFFKNQRRETPLIINYFHWIDCKESAKFGKELSGFIWRQVEGVNNADLSLLHSTHAIKLLNDSREENGLKFKEDSLFGRFIPQPTKFGNKPIPLPKEKIILFNHRLNNTTGWKEVVETCFELRKTRQDFILWLTDEQNLKELEILRQYPWIIIKKIPFESYGYLMENSHFSVCNIQGYATWNLAVLDSLYNGCMPLVPHNDLFNDMFGTDIPKFNSMYGTMQILMEDLLNADKKIINDAYMKRVTVLKDPSIVEWVENTIKDRVKNKTIKKYDDVVKHIIDNDPCFKKDFINKFWSFHANSNFQLIRWKLLSEGFNDIGYVESVYSKKKSNRNLNIA